MPKHYGLRAEPILIRTKPVTLWAAVKSALADVGRRLLFRIKVKLGWRFR